MAVAGGHAACADALAAGSARDQADAALERFGGERMPAWAAAVEAESLSRIVFHPSLPSDGLAPTRAACRL
ncbi:hypothetical protein AX768_02225 [Burkholderia sp. PAMC 28687]|nr:hypothetical protein AX768_02225 [Burkholderia sp. PAMC 28687]